MTKPNPYDQLESPFLTQLGFNMQSVFAVRSLPESVLSTLRKHSKECADSGSLLMVGNGGRQFWERFEQASVEGANPVDDYTKNQLTHYLQESWPNRACQFLYPGNLPLDLQALGRRAGWHHDSPMKVGINARWGTWYAYRALIWVSGEISQTKAVVSDSPCASCIDHPCVASCPADALGAAERMLSRCIDYRLRESSPCQNTCLARLSCPVQSDHAYSAAQTHYHYSQSYQTLVRWRNSETT